MSGILLTPVQAKNLLSNLEAVAPHNGYPAVLDFFVALTCDRMSGDRMLTVLERLAAGVDSTIALSMDLHPAVAGKVAEVGLNMVAHTSIKMAYYSIGAARLLREIGKLLHIIDEAARFLLSKPEALLYKQYLRSPQWDVKRAAAIKADGGRCRKCGKAGKLEVHHISYIRMGQERPEDLMALCPDCHRVMDERSGFGKGRKEARRG